VNVRDRTINIKTEDVTGNFYGKNARNLAGEPGSPIQLTATMTIAISRIARSFAGIVWGKSKTQMNIP
jgi:hypothetical protein